MPKARRGSPSYRESRPIDVVAPPKTPKRPPGANRRNGLPDSWVVVFDEAENWPYPDPDENGLSDPQPSFGDFPTEPSALPAVEPFSEEEPWGKMFVESDREYELFCHYRAQGITRSRKATAEHFGISRTYTSTIAVSRNWDARCREWDDYREKVYTAELILGVKEMAHKHAEIAREGVEALAIAFQGIIAAMSNDATKEEFMAQLADLPAKTQLAIAQNSARVIPTLMSAERLSRGLPTEITADLHLHEARITVQSTDDLFSILTGLAGPLAVAQSSEIEAEVIEPDD